MSHKRLVDREGKGTLGWAILLVIALGASYFAVSPKDVVSADPLTNTLTAWTVGTRGSVLLPEFEELVERGPGGTVMNLVGSPAGAVSQYPPGAAMLAAPAYWLIGDGLSQTYIGAEGSVRFEAPSVWPAALAAAGSTAGGVGLAFLAMALITDRKTALGGALVLALGTGCFSVASQALWQHGPAALWIALGILGAGWAARSGTLAWIPAALTRPHTVLIGGTTILYSAWAKRQPRHLIALVGPVLGILILCLFNYYVHGSFNVRGGYAATAIGELPDPDPLQWSRNLLGALIDPTRGLLIYSPFLIVLLPGIRRAWSTAPDWVRGAALGAGFYLLVQYTLNRFSGGDRFFGYRYPIEALVAASPLLLNSYMAWVRGHPIREIAFGIGVLAAVILQSVGVATAGNI